MPQHTDKILSMVPDKKRVAVVGSRGFNNSWIFRDKINKITAGIAEDDLLFVSGGCDTGADALIEMYCHDLEFPIIIFYPEYGKYGKRAPLERNKTIVEVSDFLIAFWDGVSTGTAHAVGLAKEKGIPIRIIKI